MNEIKMNKLIKINEKKKIKKIKKNKIKMKKNKIKMKKNKIKMKKNKIKIQTNIKYLYLKNVMGSSSFCFLTSSRHA